MNHANASAPPALNGLGVLPWLPNAIIVGVGMAGLLGCEGSQSALDPAGRCCGTNCTPVLENGDRHVLLWLAIVGLTLYAMRGEPLQHEPPKALQRAQEERLPKTWETPMSWRYDRQAPQAGANARRHALLSVTSAASHSADSG